MYKILIAEDEVFIRKALLSQMDWANMGCVVVGETGNGTQAIEQLQSLKPDILISDIQLEGKSGIEVCEFIHRNQLTVKPVLITGYGKLNYAKAAIKLNATDFIMKPIDPAELEGAVRKAIGQIVTETQRKEEMLSLQSVVKESLPLLKDKFLLQLANDNIPDLTEMAQNISFFNIYLDNYAVLALEIDEYESFLEQFRPLERQAFELVIKEICLDNTRSFDSVYYLDFAPNCHLVIVNRDADTDLAETAEAIQETLFDKYGISVSVGISGTRTELFKLNETVEEAKNALRHKFYSGNRSVIPYADIQDLVRGKMTSLFPYYFSVTKAVLVGNTAEALTQYKKLWSIIEHELDEAYVKNTVIEFIIVVQTAIRNENINLEEFSFEPNVYGLIAKQSTIQDVYGTAESLLVSLAVQVGKKISSRNRSVVDKILNYIYEHYHREITLKELGETVFMNPKYVCRLLKQETGENFTVMLTQIRIQKAKEIMEQAEHKVYEVAQKVGINDSRYFSQMFKKHTGITPIEYRNKFVTPDK